MMESAHKSQLPRGLTVKQSSEPSMFQKYVSQLKQMKEEQKKDEMTILSMYLELLKKTLKSTAFGSSYETTVAVFSGLSMVQYIYTSYLDDDQDSLRDYSKRIELAFVILFSFDWLLYLLISDSSFNYIFSFHSLVDIIVGISVFSTYNLTLVPYINLKNFYEAIKYILFLCKRVRILRALRLKYFVDQITDVVQRQIALMILVVGLMILFFSSVIQYLEVQNRESAFHTWMYFVWITLTTVGYGDITAKSTLGRIAVMIFIAIAIIIIPSLTNELIELLKLQTTYVRATYNPVSKYAQHILICGNLSTVRFPDLFAQIFHEDHNDQLNVTVVILSPEPPSHELKLFIKSGKYSIVYLQGTPFSDHDLSRAKAENATAIFLMSNKFSDQFDNEDSKIILLNIEIKQYISYYHEPYNLFCLQLHRRENRRHLYDDDFMEMLDNDLVICFNEMKLGVMAKSIHMPGISAFLLNLITSFSQEDLLHEYRHIGYKEDEAKMIVTEKTYSGKTVRILWKQEYLQGCDWEIYVSPLPSIFAGIKFSDLSYQLYEKFGIILFGLEITDRYHSDYSKVFLNPANYIIPNDFDQFYIEAFVIAKDESQADFSFLFGVKAKESERKPKNPGFYIPDGYTVTDKQVITRIREENDDVHHREPSDTESANSPKIPTTHITDFTTPKSPKGYRSRTERNKFQYLKQSSLLAKGYGGITYEETLSRLENQHLHSHYYTRRMPVDVDKVTIKHHLTDEIPSVNNHIIIIGKVNFNWYDLIKPLRARSLGPVQPIALVSPTPLSNDMWQRIGIFEEVYFIKGTPLEEINLVRAGIFRASKVIILADVSDYNHQAAEAIDADVIFAYHFVSRLNPNINIMVEVMNPKNIIYLDRHFNEKTMSENYLLSSIFANGLLFPTSLLDSVVSQSYYNPHIVKVFSKFLELPEDYNRIDRAIDASKLLLASTEYLSASAKISNIDLPDLLKEDSPLKTMQGSCFYSIKVNESMVRKPYIQVYQELSLKGIIPLAVLRGTQPHSIMDIGPLGNRLPYVYTNPHSESRLFLCDHLFVLSIEPLIEREASHVNENFTPNFGGPSYSPSPFDMKAPFNTYAPSVPTQNANDSPTERNNESSDSGQRILGFDNQTSVPVKTKTPVVDFHTAPLEPSFFNEKFNQVIQQINQQLHKKFENFIDEQDQRHQEILKRLDQVQQQQLQQQQQQQMRGPPKSNSADDSEKESDIKVVPIMLQQPRASSMATVRPSGFVNSEEDLLEKQKQYEMRAKPESKYFFQEPRRINTGGGSSVTSKKILAPKITSPILGPTIHDLNRTRSKYTRHPYLSQENSVAGQSFYDMNNQDDTSSLATFDDDNSIKSRGNGLVLSNADGSSPSLLNSLFIKK